MKNKIILIAIQFVIMSTSMNAQDYGRIEDRMLKCVINIDGLGTGFLVGRNIPNKENQSKVYLVTNKHMIGNWNLVDKLNPKSNIIGFFYSTNDKNPIKGIKIPLLDKSNNLLPTVKVHPNQKIDIVVIDVTPQLAASSDLYISRFDMSYLVPLDSIGTTTYTGIGDQVYAIGYPAGITSKTTNQPIVKSGYISSSLSGDLEIYSNTKDRKGNIHRTTADGKFFLVDGLIIGGNSGGPIVHPKQGKYRIVDSKLSYTENEIPNLIFGIVSHGIGNTGISVIYASDHIIELINEFKLK